MDYECRAKRFWVWIGQKKNVRSSSEFHWSILFCEISTTVTLMWGHFDAIIAIVGPPTYPAPMQHIFIEDILYSLRFVFCRFQAMCGEERELRSAVHEQLVWKVFSFLLWVSWGCNGKYNDNKKGKVSEEQYNHRSDDTHKENVHKQQHRIHQLKRIQQVARKYVQRVILNRKREDAATRWVEPPGVHRPCRIPRVRARDHH